MTLSIVIPSHNEERRIASTLKKLFSFMQSNRKRLGSWANYEVIIVDDGKDATIQAAKNAARQVRKKIMTVHFPSRKGKGFAVRAGMRAAHGDVLIYDADASAAPSQIFKLKRAIDSGADVAIGSRYLPGSSAEGKPLARRVASRSFNLLVRHLLGLPFKDTQCGFKAIRAPVAKKLADATKHDGFSWDLEMILRAVQLGYVVEEVPIQWRHVPGENISGVPLHTALDLGGDLVRLKLNK